MQKHGANIYLPDGRPSGLLDFSNTVVEVPPPAGWEKRLAKGLGSLRAYPQPYAAGLAQHIEKKLHLAPGSVLIGNGSSECLSWIAQSLAGRKVLLETPCFGEYAVLLARAGAFVREIGADEPWSPDWARLKKAAEDSESLWLADPANPSGLRMDPEELGQRIELCRKEGVLLVLDEAIRAQALKDPGEASLRQAVKAPGVLVVRSLSKGLGLPGLRLGYVAGHPLEIAKLGRYLDPWTVSSLAQATGPWLFDEERRLASQRRRTLVSWKKDLLKRLKALPEHSLHARESDTGFFLCRLLSRIDNSRKLVEAMAKQGMLLRSCSSYGGWGTGYIRLNPRSPKDNAELVAAFRKLYAKA